MTQKRALLEELRMLVVMLGLGACLGGFAGMGGWGLVLAYPFVVVNGMFLLSWGSPAGREGLCARGVALLAFVPVFAMATGISEWVIGKPGQLEGADPLLFVLLGAFGLTFGALVYVVIAGGTIRLAASVPRLLAGRQLSFVGEVGAEAGSLSLPSGDAGGALSPASAAEATESRRG